MSFQLVWLYDPAALKAEMPDIIQGTERVLRFGFGDMNMHRVYNEVNSGQVQVWAAIRDGRRIGYLFTKVQEVHLGDRWLLIYMIFSLKGQVMTDENYAEAFKMLDDYCKRMGCSRMEFYTIRDAAFERHLSGHGWQRRYTIFSREVV